MPASLIGSIVLILASPTLADSPSRKPWQWTTEERLAQRFDPEAIKVRQSAHEAAQPRKLKPARVDRPAGPVTACVIDGKRNPELFLPHELFTNLMSAFHPDADLRTRQRATIEARLRAYRYDLPDFWPRLETVASEYLALEYGSAQNSSHDQWLARCRARHAALQAARNTFDGFDALLYQVVAPASQYAVATDVANPAARLKNEAEGCR